MRIIGGEFRGRKLISPADRKIRPTIDRVREDIFNILTHYENGLPGTNILDVFAGTGALGLEALSRGAAHVTFFDRDQTSLKLIKQNIARLNGIKKTTLKCISAPLLPRSTQKYNFIFLDPPYNLNIIELTIAALQENSYTTRGSILVVELKQVKTLALPCYLELLKEKIYGNIKILFLRIISENK